jgi:hypothetical protein
MKVTLKFKTFAILSFCAIFALPIQSCKKGSDDPAISLRSRKARVVGEWTLKEVKENGKAITMSGTTTYNFKKDGTGSTSFKFNSLSSTDNFRWDFLGGNGDYKKKERLVIYDEKSPDGLVYELIELRNKKIVWKLVDESGSSKDETIFTLEQ